MRPLFRVLDPAVKRAASFFIVGGQSLLGGALAGYLREKGIHCLASTRRSADHGYFLDLNRLPGAERLPRPLQGRPGTAVLCAGQTSLEACRRSPEAAWFVNVVQTLKLAEMLTGLGWRICFISSGQIFDGDKPVSAETPPAPQTEYGRQKAAVEDGLKKLAGDPLIIRLSKVVHPSLPLFVRWAETLRAGGRIEAFDDMRLAPVHLRRTVEIMAELAAAGSGGICGISSPDAVSYFEAARFLARILGCDETLVEPAKAGDHLPPGFVNRHPVLPGAVHPAGAIEALTGCFKELAGEARACDND